MIQVNEYAKALLELATEENCVDTVLEEAVAISDMLENNGDYVKILDSPAISNNERLKLIDEAFSGCNVFLLNFIKILCEKRSVYAFCGCVENFKKQYDELNNIETAVAVTTVPLSKEQIEALKRKLEKSNGKTVNIVNEIDASVLGGIVLRVGDKQLDGSIKARLDTFKSSLNKTIV